MQFDIEKRGKRDKTFDNLKENFELKESRNNTLSRKSSPLKEYSKSPYREGMPCQPDGDEEEVVAKLKPI